MSKRFTDSEKWGKKWFRELPPKWKLFWVWLLDNCDNAGVIEPDLMVAGIYAGGEIKEEEALEVLKKQIISIGECKWWIKDFINFQCGTSFNHHDPKSYPHKNVVSLLIKHGIMRLYEQSLKEKTTLPTTLPSRLPNSLPGSPKDKDKDIDKEEEKEKEKERGEEEGLPAAASIGDGMTLVDRYIFDASQRLRLSPKNFEQAKRDISLMIDTGIKISDFSQMLNIAGEYWDTPLKGRLRYFTKSWENLIARQSCFVNKSALKRRLEEERQWFKEGEGTRASPGRQGKQGGPRGITHPPEMTMEEMKEYYEGGGQNVQQ